MRLVSRRHRRALTSQLSVLVLHLLKRRYQSARRTPSWQQTITEQRQRLTRLLRDHLSLRPSMPALLVAVYPGARADTLDETGMLDLTLPQTCPWTVAQVLDADFWPEAQALILPPYLSLSYLILHSDTIPTVCFSNGQQDIPPAQ